MRREHRLTQVVKEYDPKLFVKSDETGKMHLIRKTTRMERISFNGQSVLCSRPDYQSIFSLTDNWLSSGTAVDWGIEPIMARIREIDSHRSGEILDRINAAADEVAVEKKREVDRKSDRIAREMLDPIRKDFADYNMSSRIKTKDIEQTLKTKIEKEGL